MSTPLRAHGPGWADVLADHAVEETTGRRLILQLAACEAALPDLVLQDLILPDINGFAVIRELRKHDEWTSIPIVALSTQNLTADECRRLEGRVQQIINTDADVPQALTSVLRELPVRPESGAPERHEQGETVNAEDTAR